MTDWRRAIQQGFGISIPPTFTMKFVERDPGVDALIVLPDFRSSEDELSDRELESIAGGFEDDGSAAEWADAVDDEAAPW